MNAPIGSSAVLTMLRHYTLYSTERIGQSAKAIKVIARYPQVEGVEAMSAAMLQAHVIDPQVCRAVAAERFSFAHMTEAYLEVYHRLARMRFAGAA